MRKRARMLTAVALAAVVVAGGSAYTAANTVAASAAGQGSGTITGYDVANVKYTFATAANEADLIEKAVFNVTPTAPATTAPNVVKARFRDATGALLPAPQDAYATCSKLDAAKPTEWTCTWSGTSRVAAGDAGEFDVLAHL